MQGEALFDIRKRPSPIEKGVPSILEYYHLYSCLALLCKLIAVFTPLSIRRGVGGEASSRMEKGVSLILEYDNLYSCLVLLCKLIAVFTPLSIRRGVGGEAVDGRELGWLWLVGRLFVRLRKASSPQVLTRKTLLTVGDFLWSTSYHEASPFVSSIGTKVNDVVSTLDDVKVMFDD